MDNRLEWLDAPAAARPLAHVESDGARLEFVWADTNVDAMCGLLSIPEDFAWRRTLQERATPPASTPPLSRPIQPVASWATAAGGPKAFEPGSLVRNSQGLRRHYGFHMEERARTQRTSNLSTAAPRPSHLRSDLRHRGSSPCLRTSAPRVEEGLHQPAASPRPGPTGRRTTLASPTQLAASRAMPVPESLRLLHTRPVRRGGQVLDSSFGAQAIDWLCATSTACSDRVA